MATDYGMSLAAAARVAAYIERLETALTAHQSGEYAAVKDMQCLATIAREAEANVKGQEANAVFALQLKREAEARAAEWIDRCHQSEARALKAEAMCEWMAEELVVSGWCRPDGERENAPCQEDGEGRRRHVPAGDHEQHRRCSARSRGTCCECALKAAEEAVRR